MNPIKRYYMELASNMQVSAYCEARRAREFLAKALENPEKPHYAVLASMHQRTAYKLYAEARITFDDFMCEE